VLRGLEEEAQKQRAEGLTVRVAPDVAIYTLNQKRRELARLETEYTITINFDPKPELMAGEFEIDRIGHRNPEDFPRPAMTAVTEPVMEEEELDIIEEEELDEEDEVIEAAEAGVVEQAETPARAEPANRDSGRRRRRRGGRNRGGRDRDRPGPREHTPPQDGVPAIEGGDAVAARTDSYEGMESSSSDQIIAQEPHTDSQFTGPAGEGPRRKRRRRRGRRGGNRDHLADGTAPPSSDAPTAPVLVPPAAVDLRFGVPDEIDTTPRDEPRMTPNTASSPSWSLNDTAEIDTTPKEEDKPALPAKKGWWQRAFKT
jgi:ribonuclease E